MKYSLIVFAAFMVVMIPLCQCDEKKEEEVVSQEKVDYAKGSLCKYCDYCKFCQLCDEQCPCETGPGKPACNMCKYCKFCYLCSAACDTICKPGGIIDRVSGAVINALPTVNLGEVDSDLDQHKVHIEKKRTEL